MASGENITTKFKVDISDLKAGISEANKQIKLANAEFKAASAGMDNWGKSTEGVKAKLAQLDSVLQAQNSKLAAYKDQLKRQEEAYAENGKRAEELKQKLQELADKGISKTSSEYKEYEKALSEVEKEQISNGKAIDQLKLNILNQEAAVKSTSAEIDKYGKTLDSLESEQKAAADAANRQASAYESLEGTINDQQNELDALKRKYAEIVVAQGKDSDAAKELAGDIDKLSTELQQNKSKIAEADKAADDLDNSLRDAGDSAEKSSGGFTVLKGALANLVADGIRLAINAVKDFARETIEVGKQFDSSMSQVQAVSGATGADLDALREKAKEMGESTKFTASEAADAFNYMAMAGWKTEEMLSGIDGVLALAAASGSDLATTSDIVTDALTAFGQSASDAGRLADIMAAASSNANTNVEMMGATFKYVAPIAGAMGYSMEDTAVAIGLMANAGIKAEKAGTSLRSILTRLAAPPKEAATAMNELGIEITNADGTMKPFSEVIEILRDSFDGLSEAEQAQFAKMLAGQEAMSGLLAVVNAAPADFEKLTDAVNDSNGAAEEMAETMQDNLGGDLTKLSSQFEGIKISLYEKFEPALRSGVEVLKKFGDALNWLIDHSGEVVSVLGSMAAGVAAYLAYTTAITVMTKGWMALTVVQKAVTAAQWLMNAAMAANPVGILIAAITALVAAFILLWKKSEAFRNFFIGIWDGIVNAVSTAVDWIKEAVGKVVDWFKENWQSLLLFVTNPIAGIFKYLYDHFDGFREFVDNIVNSIKEFFTNLWTKVVEIWTKMVEGIKNAVSGIAEWIYSNVIEPVVNFFMRFIWPIIAKVGEIIAKIIEILLALAKFVGSWIKENIVDPIVTKIVELYEKVKEWVQKAWDAVVAVWEKVADWFKEHVTEPVAKFFSDLWDKIKKTFSKVKDWFSEKFTAAKKAVTDAWSKIADWFKDKWDKIKEVFSPVTNWFSEKFGEAWQAIKDKFSKWGEYWSGLWDQVKEKFSGLGTKIGDAIGDAVKSGINSVIGLVEGAINKAIGLINGAIDMVNKVPGVDISHVQPLNLPRLAQGGVLKRGQVGLLEGSGAEAVVPLERNKQWIKSVAADMMRELKNSVNGNSISNISNSKVNNFTQVINAPKQPSRIELYRQTRNLLAYAGEAGGI